MPTLEHVYLYLLTVPVFLAMDVLWIGVIAKDLYQKQLAGFLGPVNWPAAVTFYLIFIIGILVFAVLPALEARSVMKAMMLGALFGFMTYATYDLTNLATLKNWPLSVTLIDMAWGACISGSVATASYFIGKSLSL